MKVLYNIREFIWPLLEGEPVNEIEEFSEADILSEDNLEEVFKVALKIFETEEDRIKTIDSKSSLFIGTISVITTVIIAVTTGLVKDSFNIPTFILVLLLIILTLYMARTIWFSIRVLERRTFEIIDIDDYLTGDEDKQRRKNLIVKLVNKTRKNSLLINGKVDFMVMAQEYFKRAIVVVSLYSFVVLIYYVSKSEIISQISGTEVANFFNGLSIGGWNVIVIYILLAVSIVLSFRAFNKLKKHAVQKDQKEEA